MVVYSVTVKVDIEVHDVFKNWLIKEHIPEVMATNRFLGYKMYKVLVHNEQDGITYNIQYQMQSMEQYFLYQEQDAPSLQEKTKSKFGDKFVAFRTLLKEVHSE